jgi:hypothetical protein
MQAYRRHAGIGQGLVADASTAVEVALQLGRIHRRDHQP